MSPTKGFDFAGLGLKDALDLAVLIEEEARDRYLEFADQMELHHTPEAEGFFGYMARNEEKHRVALASRRTELFGDAPGTANRTMLFDVEAPDYDEVRAFMTPRQALESALRAEEKAHAFFAAALLEVRDASVRVLFEELCAEELEHQALVQGQIEQLPPDSGLDPADFADDPVGQ